MGGASVFASARTEFDDKQLYSMERLRNTIKKVTYNSTNGQSIEVKIDDTTAWLNQKQIADLFGIRRSTVTKRINEIIKLITVDKDAVCSVTEHTASDGKSYTTHFYNLDIILFIGYRYDFMTSQFFRKFCDIEIRKWNKRINLVNEVFWFKRISKATKSYCNEFLKLSEGDVTEDEIQAYMDLIIKLRNSDVDEDRINGIIESKSVFPEDIRGYLCHKGLEKIFQPNHLMCKLAILRDETNRVNYEFLIEYDIFDPATEIYYGVKAVSDYMESSDNFIENAERKWIDIRDSRRDKSRKNKEKSRRGDFYAEKEYRFKETDNSNNGTFWPFWIRYNKELESLSDVVGNLRRIFKDFKRHHKFTLLPDYPERFAYVIDIIKEKDVLDYNPFEKIDRVIIKNLKMESKVEFHNIILHNLVEKGMIKRRKDDRYELKATLTELSTYMRAAFYVMYKRRKEIDKYPAVDLIYDPPIERFSEIILNGNGGNTRIKSWGNEFRDNEKYIEEVKSWFEKSS